MTKQWHLTSNTIVLLSVEDELALKWLVEDLEDAALKVIPFYEPDLGNELTALAVEPAGASSLSHLSLALKGGETHD